MGSFALPNEVATFSPKSPIESIRSSYSDSMSSTSSLASSRRELVPCQPDPELTPEQALHASYQTLRHTLATDLLEQIKQASPAFFEQLVVDDYGVGVTTEATYDLKRIEADYFTDE